ncbi:hypothetical protein FOZ60_015911 [Perkinsus olseni]|uniref:Uncharacterized protein n=1 Tax=Perkinsus olseni TaxID=32597 RepID=A0A7J6TXB4_PEROL|nr:hypothetical protein FOZ60_015911 [Perkinsus olseni]KAF4749908.1 hypothetical protein FOZ62_020883 [Perkinsus olseni]
MISFLGSSEEYRAVENNLDDSTERRLLTTHNGLPSSDRLEVKLRPEPCQCPVILKVDSDWMPQGYSEFGQEYQREILPRSKAWPRIEKKTSFIGFLIEVNPVSKTFSISHARCSPATDLSPEEHGIGVSRCPMTGMIETFNLFCSGIGIFLVLPDSSSVKGHLGVNNFSLPEGEGWDGLCGLKGCRNAARIANKVWFNKSGPPTLSTLLEVCKDTLGNATAGASPKLIEEPMMGLRNAVNRKTTDLEWKLGF